MTPGNQDPRWHGSVLALDPGLRSPGVALFTYGVLVACAKVKIPASFKDLPVGARSHRVAQEILAWLFEQPEYREHVGKINTVIFEWPQIYSESQGKSKGNPNQLVPLAAIGTAVYTALAIHNSANDARPPELLTPLPAEWTGQLPKSTTGNPWDSPRGQRVLSRLAIGEQEVIPSQHDAIDSCGLGLFALGRYAQVRRFHGAV